MNLSPSPLEAAPAKTVIEIAPSPAWRAVDFKEIWRYRELLWIFVQRDIKVRYRQTVLGGLWALVQPLTSMVMFTLLFHRIAKLDAGVAVPYSVFVLCGLLPWNFFSAGVQNAGNSLIGNAHLISKVYFPRLIVPLASVLVGFADFGVALLLLVALMVWMGVIPGIGLALLPFVMLLTFFLALGIALWLAALNVEYRDIRVVIPFLIQIGFFGTPIAYPLHSLPPTLRSLALWNPMTAIVETFRAGVVGGPVPWEMLGRSILVSIVLLISGTLYFRRMERQFADVL
ncbi:MAG: ABC transporter permease [Acidobacteriota bacterium]|nr:ABC transporter permease [Acidobacteriota bacterium]